MDSSFLLILRVAGSLGAVLALLWFVQRRVGRTGGRRTANLITVLSRRGVGRSASVVVLDAEGQRFVLGVTEQSITVLSSEKAPPAPPMEDALSVDVPKASVGPSAWEAATAGSILSPDTWRRAKEATKASPRKNKEAPE